MYNTALYIQRYCYDFGQPYAPATNPEDEIWPIMRDEDIPQFLQNKRGV